MRRIIIVIAALASVVLAAVGCGDGQASTNAQTVDVYSSLPLQGATGVQGNAYVNGIRLALEQAGGKAGQWTVNYTSLDDSTAAAGKWDPGQTAANARKVATDSKAVYYIGEFNTDASKISMPILNQAGVTQVSPGNTYVGLTTNLPGSAPGEPQKYYRTGTR
ncbi:MAG: ABC transporter substrate-binding protein, partial [Frankiaceae bacterium]